MRISSFRPRVSFQVKVLVPVVSVMVLLMAVTIWLVNRRISQQLHERSAQQLETASSLFRELEDIRTRDLLARYRNLFKEPRFKAVIQRGDAETVREVFGPLLFIRNLFKRMAQPWLPALSPMPPIPALSAPTAIPKLTSTSFKPGVPRWSIRPSQDPPWTPSASVAASWMSSPFPSMWAIKPWGWLRSGLKLGRRPPVKSSASRAAKSFF